MFEACNQNINNLKNCLWTQIQTSCVSETWLAKTFPSASLAMPDINISDKIGKMAEEGFLSMLKIIL